MAHYLSFLPRYNIERIVVGGASRVLATDIEAYAFESMASRANPFFSSSNVLLYQPRLVERALLAHLPALKSARVARSSPLSNTLQIEVKEREAYALWCASENLCFDIDRDGLIFAKTAAARAAGYVFSGGMASSSSDPVGVLFAEEHVEEIVGFLDGLTAEHFAPEGAHVESDRDFTVPLVNSYYLKASFGQNAQDLVKNLQLVLSSDALKEKHGSIEYIDLRFGDRVYYKLKGQTDFQSH